MLYEACPPTDSYINEELYYIIRIKNTFSYQIFPLLLNKKNKKHIYKIFKIQLLSIKSSSNNRYSFPNFPPYLTYKLEEKFNLHLIHKRDKAKDPVSPSSTSDLEQGRRTISILVIWRSVVAPNHPGQFYFDRGNNFTCANKKTEKRKREKSKKITHGPKIRSIEREWRRVFPDNFRGIIPVHRAV